jgi:hypothetical protein
MKYWTVCPIYYTFCLQIYTRFEIVTITNALLFVLVTAEVLRSSYQIIQYRRSA